MSQELIYNCCECEKDFDKAGLCEHSHDIIQRNVGKFAFDDMVMCVSCCNSVGTWEKINQRIIDNGGLGL